MFIAPPADSEDTARLYDANAKSQGFVMNLTRAWAWRPDVFAGFAALRSDLTTKSTLSKREQAVIVCATASELGDSYCSLAWGRTLADLAGADAAAAGIGSSSTDRLNARESALATWSRKVVADPNGTSADDVAALREAGVSEQEIVEATIFIAFRLAFSTVNDALGVRPDWQLGDAAPEQVRAAVAFGRLPAAKRA
ncbi:MAG: carboxymuconolactone decarboxylase family protein [Caldimonas sp.]